MPAAGYIDWSNVTFKFNATANYFSSTPNNATQAYTLTYDSGNGNDPKTEGKWRSNGRSVRCFKNTNEAYRVIFTSVDWLTAPAQSVAKWWTSYATRPEEDPVRSNSEFIWWFYSWSSTEFDFENTPIIEDITLYAKWNCKYWLVESEEEKYCEGETTITFDANWWKFSDGVTQKTATYIIDENQFISDLNIKIPSKEPEWETWYMFDWWYTTWLDARWTWYIVETLYAKYKPFKDLKLNYSWVEIIIMDRNLWAMEAWTWCSDVNSGACWYQYERGNNYGFAYIPINGNKQFPNGERIIWKAADDWTGKISTYYSSLFRSVYSWNSWATTLDNLWWWENSLNFDETKQWPCPNGYHVPNYSERYSLYNLRKSVYSGDDNNQSNTLSNELLLPFAGWRKASDGKIQSVWILWWYRSSSSDSARISRGILLNLGNEIWIPHWWWKSDPLSVRCFKNTWKPIQFETNGWTLNTEIEVNKRWWEDAIELDVPTKENYYFWWWYTTPDFQSWTKVETNEIDTADDKIKLYVKWNDLVVNFDTNRWTYINSHKYRFMR